MCAAGQEGIISKRADAAYRGVRSHAWLKVKCTRRQEFVIVGWTPSTTANRAIKNLILADHRDGTLAYVGRVGTGFDARDYDMLRSKLKTRVRTTATVIAPVADTRGVQWVRPGLIAEIGFAEFTSTHVLRHASFIGLREDKTAGEVEQELSAPPPAGFGANAVSNRGRIIFPEAKITKGQLADYYAQIGGLMLPWVSSRPISLVRCPQGRGKKCFFQKHDSGSFGDHVAHIPITDKAGASEDYLYVRDIDGLVACVQMGTIEFHGWGSRIDNVEKPDRMIFDLDPDETVDFDHVKKAAIDIRRTLEDIGLVSFALLSGGKGIHVVVPLTPDAAWPDVKDFASRFATALAQAEPDRFVATMSKAKRKGRIFIDWLRNQRGATAIMPYSVRERPGAPVAIPLAWDELNDVGSANAYSLVDAKALIERADDRALSRWGIGEQRLPAL